MRSSVSGEASSQPGLAGPSSDVNQKPNAWLHGVWPAIRTILVLAPLVPVLFILSLIWNRTTLTAWWDEWYVFFPLLQAADAGTLSFSQIWEPATGHRIALPRLVGLALIEITGWNRQIQLTIYLLVGVAAVLLVLAAVRRTFDSVNTAIILAGPVALLMLSLTQYENWLWPLGFGFIVTSFSAALCVWALTSQSGWAAVAISGVGALAASLSTAAGTVMLIAFLPAFWFLGKRYFAVWLMATVAVVASYVTQGNEGSVLGGRPDSPHEVLHSLQYMAAFLGAPISRTHPVWSIGAVVLSCFLLLASVIVLYRMRVNFVTLFSWLGLAGFAVGCAVLIGLGRAGWTSDLTIPSRYDAFSSLWWVAVLVLVGLSTVLLVSDRPRISQTFIKSPGGRLVGVNVIALAVLVFALVVANIQGFRLGYSWMTFPLQQQQCVLEPRYASDFCLSIFHTQPAIARSQELYIESRQFGIFRGRTPLDVGKLRQESKPASGAISFVNRQPVVLLPEDQAVVVSATPTVSRTDSRREERQAEKRRDRKQAAGKNAKPFLTPSGTTDSPLAVPAGQSIPVMGWAQLDVTSQPAGGVLVSVDDAAYVWATYGWSLPEKVKTSDDAPPPGTGFVAFLPTNALTNGLHSLRIMVLTPDLQSYALAPQTVTIEVQDLPELDIGSLTERDQMANGAVERVNNRLIPNQHVWPFAEPANEPLEIVGWVADPIERASAHRAFLLVDGTFTFPVEVGFPRGEVAMWSHNPPITEGVDFALVGYKAVIPAGALEPGKHRFEVRVVTQDERSYFAPNPKLSIEIELK